MKTSHLFGSRACRRKLYVVNCAALGPLADENNAPQPLGNAYRYDQLNRLVHAKSYRNLDLQANVWKDNAPNAQIYENIFSYDLNGNIESQLRRDETGFTMDNLTYRYDDGTYGRKRNRLYHVNDAVTASAYPDDIDDQGTFDPEAVNQNNNYRYDELGRLVFDAQENIADIEWRHDDKIALILKSDTGGGIEFTYDPSGNRISKGVFTGPQFDPIYIDYYIRDAQGNVLATYRRHFDHDFGQSHYTVSERAIYGSDRMGVYAYNDTVYPIPPTWTDDFRPVHTGHKKYELKNHLGNVMAVVHGRKQAVQGTGITISHYTAIPAFSGDYSAFGVRLRGRGEGEYRFGFGGQEKDDEIAGFGNSYTAMFWQYDPRLGKRWNRDPVVKPWESGYAVLSNNPVWYIDPLGLDVINAHEKENNEAKDKLELSKERFSQLNKGDEGYRTAKKELKKNQRIFDNVNKKYLRVESKINDIKKRDPELFDNANNLKDPGGTEIDIYVYDTRHDIMQEGVKSGRVRYGDTDAQPGVDILSAQGNFPQYTQVLSERHGNNTITIRISDIGRTIHLAHEFGHAIYMGENMRQYIEWLQENPKEQGKGGHGKGDPSGKAADWAEKKFK